MNQEVIAYLNEALDYIQENSVMSARIDWPTLRQEVSGLVAQAQTPIETYPAIKRVLEILGDHHSHFRHPASVQQLERGQANLFGFRAVYPEGIVGIVYPNSSAEHAGIQVGDQVATINGQPITDLSFWQLRELLVSHDEPHDLRLTLKPLGKLSIRSVYLQATSYDTTRKPQGKLFEYTFGYLDLPGLTGSIQQTREYALTVQQRIREIDQHSPKGWIIDLRRNTGGNMWPMVAGIGPILGEGEWVAFVNNLEKQTAFYRRGQTGILPDAVLAKVDEPYELRQPALPVAVLTSQLTSSSGEFIALAFRGLPHTYSIGEPTQGVPTANGHKKLSDGALIVLTSALGVDRLGQVYDSPLSPNYSIRTDWTQLGTSNDPVLQAAIQWLHSYHLD